MKPPAEPMAAPEGRVRLELRPSEALLLSEALAEALADLRTEIHRTDSRVLRGELEERETVLKAIRERLAPWCG